MSPPDANYNNYQMQNVNSNFLRPPFAHPQNNMNENQFRTLKASDPNTANGFLSNYSVSNVSHPNANWDGDQNTTRSTGEDLTNEYCGNHQFTFPATVRFRDDQWCISLK